jgi:two-component system chemotaxis response regulator CheY
MEAMELIADTFFDLIVTDYNMPRMNGKELVEHIRSGSSQASVPILMVTSEQNENRLAAVQQAGISAICDKPFEPDSVRRLVEQTLSEH